jgi:nucleotide-binding universal stress UspA family protein
MIYKKILLAYDGSDVSREALTHSIKLAKNQHATLYVLYVVEESFGFRGGIGYDYDDLISLYKEEGEKVLQEATDLIEESSINHEPLLVQLNTFQGRVADVVIDKAKELAVDLIVAGTHGRRGINHLILGSVAEDITRMANTPVLLIRSSVQ